MATQPHPLFLHFIVKMLNSCKHKWEQLHDKIHSLKHDVDTVPSHATVDWPSLDEMSLAPVEEKAAPAAKTVVVQQWPLSEGTPHTQQQNAVIMEVEFYPTNPYNQDIKSSHRVINYTVEGDDPNLRITHFPPSNRLH